MTPNTMTKTITGIAGADNSSSIRADILRRLLDGSEYAAAIMPWGPFGPIRLPDDAAGRDELIRCHLTGSPVSVRFAPIGKPEQRIRVDALQLGAYTPRADGACGWIAFDLDGGSHGSSALWDPDRAAAAIAERAAAAGLWSGVLIVKSRSGSGRHVWIILPDAAPIADACIGAVGLAARARRIANADAADNPDRPHAFLTRAGQIATVGQAGAFEVSPKSVDRPARGYAMALPFGSVARQRGGGIAVDVFEHPTRIIDPSAVPVCDAWAWQRLIAETQAELSAKQRARRRTQSLYRAPRPCRLDPRTQQLIDGTMSEGGRNKAAYFGYRDLIRSGVTPSEAKRLLVTGAERCGLARREAEATVQSARRRWGDRL